MNTPTVNPIVSGGAGAGLWIRVSANLSRRKVTWRLTESCLAMFPVPAGAPRSLMQKAAMGFLQELWGNIAEHTIDGVIAHLPDAQLEQWAGWDGEPGVFAKWLRASHIDADTGCVREWNDFAGALQSKRQNDAQRQRDKRERDKAARSALEAGRVQQTELGVQKSDGAPRGAGPPARVETASPYRLTLTADDVTDIAREMTIALNKGMNENARMNGMYNPVHAGRGDSLEFVTYLASEGVTDFDLVGRCVYTIAKTYEPTKAGDQIGSLKFCQEKALAMVRRAVARAQAEKAGPIEEVSAPRGKSGKHIDSTLNSTSRGARSAAGALVAAGAVGLPDA